ncbi:MAG: hypothetical protein AB7N99_07760 [Simkaniaceae bacterium]|jgi:hypothetical protein
MSYVQVAGALAAKTSIAAAINVFGSWGSRFVNWYPQATLPCVISACVYTASEFPAIRIQQALFSELPSHHYLPRGYQKTQQDRIRMIASFIGAVSATILTPKISARLGYSISGRAAFVTTLPSILLSYLMPPSKRRTI